MTTETIYATMCKPVQSLVKYQSYYRNQSITECYISYTMAIA